MKSMHGGRDNGQTMGLRERQERYILGTCLLQAVGGGGGWYGRGDSF